jgi:type I restriction enzyme, S subunit
VSLPDKWRNALLGDVLDSIRNGTSATQNSDRIGVPVTRIETISQGIIDTERVGWIRNVSQLGDYRLKIGDVLFSHINSIEHIGKCALYEGVPETLFHGMNLLLLRSNSKLIHSEYLLRCLRSESINRKIRNRANLAVNQASLNQLSLKRIGIPLPPLFEQDHIVKILKQAEKIRNLRNSLYALPRNISLAS